MGFVLSSRLRDTVGAFGASPKPATRERIRKNIDSLQLDTGTRISQNRHARKRQHDNRPNDKEHRSNGI
ncbi:hypothetical protein BaRGS_00037077 [Batillaria attramentaria]|uniref:Uncharacterized protein n=1 Tax=Batillaria attramentaria TaxID=370345 RepID=A0ABD0JA29_9CAEN